MEKGGRTYAMQTLHGGLFKTVFPFSLENSNIHPLAEALGQQTKNLQQQNHS
jgi:hypothetical protein